MDTEFINLIFIINITITTFNYLWQNYCIVKKQQYSTNFIKLVLNGNIFLLINCLVKDIDIHTKIIIYCTILYSIITIFINLYYKTYVNNIKQYNYYEGNNNYIVIHIDDVKKEDKQRSIGNIISFIGELLCLVVFIIIMEPVISIKIKYIVIELTIWFATFCFIISKICQIANFYINRRINNFSAKDDILFISFTLFDILFLIQILAVQELTREYLILNIQFIFGLMCSIICDFILLFQVNYFKYKYNCDGYTRG